MSVKTKNEKIPPPVTLRQTLENLTCSFTAAKMSTDQTSINIAQEYANNRFLSSLTSPLFTFSEINIQLKFAVQKVDVDNKDIYVLIDVGSLQKIDPNLISCAELKVTPTALKLYKTNTDKTILEANSN